MNLNRISYRLFGAFVLLSVLPLFLLDWTMTTLFEQTQQRMELESLSILADKKQDQISAYLQERISDGEVLAQSQGARQAVQAFARVFAQDGLHSTRYREADRLLSPRFRNLIDREDFYDVLLIDHQGHVVFSVLQELDLGTSLVTGPYRDSVLAGAHRNAQSLLTTQVTGVELYAPSDKRPSMFIAIPVMDGARPIGTLALQLNLQRLASVTSENTGLGQTGEVVLAQRSGQSVLYASPVAQRPAFEHRVPLDKAHLPVQQALQGDTGRGLLADEGGKSVLAVWRYLPELRWAMVIQIDASEALAPLAQMRRWSLGALGLLLLLVAGVASGLGRALSRPIQELATVAEGIAAGDLGRRASVAQGSQELRQLASTFNSMTDKLQASHATLEQQVHERTEALSRALELQQAAQQFLVESTDRLDEAQRLAHVGSWELDLVAGRLSWSDEIFRLFEIDKSKFAATYEAFLGAIHPEDRDAVNQAYSQSLVDRAPYEITHRLLMPDGRIKWVHERCTSNFDAEGKPVRSVGTVQDISPQRQAELALEQLNRELEDRVETRTAELRIARDEAERASQAKSDFLSRMSHELRTPMNAILGFGQLLESDEDEPLTDSQTANVQEMLRAGRHLLALINEMLDLAQVESGRIDMSPEPVEVPPLIQDCLGLMRALAQQRGITLHLDAPVRCVVRADRLRLRQVLLNLLSNAIKYNRDAGRVDIHCGPGQPGQVRIEVRDTGKGIAPENLARLFKPFERLESAYQGIEGTGIGLALTRRLVEAMDGQVGVSSVPGTGSTFWVELPAALEAAMEMPALAAPTQIVPAVVIYIEDNQLNLKVMQQVFSLRPQWTLHAAHSAEEGIDLARAHTPALILMDINLPGMDGYQALAVLQADADTAHIPVLAVSANAMLGDRERGLKAGFVDYVTKPLDVPTFLQLLDHLLGAHHNGTHRIMRGVQP